MSPSPGNLRGKGVGKVLYSIQREDLRSSPITMVKSPGTMACLRSYYWRDRQTHRACELTRLALFGEFEANGRLCLKG